MTRRALSIAALVTCSLASIRARADEYHYQGDPLGARAAGLGGAFVALATDSSAALYNPAGLVLSTGTQFSLSTNAYSLITERIGGSTADQPPAFRAFPSTFAVIKTPFFVDEKESNPRHRYGFAILVTDATQISRVFVREGEPVSLVRASDTTTLYGAAYAYRATERLSVGISAWIVERELVRFESRAQPRGGGEFSLFRRELEGTHYGAQLVLGALFRATERWSFGASLRSPTQGLYGSLTLNEFSKDAGVFLEERTSEKGFFENRVPASGMLGVAFRVHERLLVTADLSGYTALGHYKVLQTEDLSETVTKQPVINAALGAEVHMSAHFPLRVGVFTDRSSQAAGFTDPFVGRTPHIYGFTLSAGYETERAAVVIGGAYELGRGMIANAPLDRRELRWWVAGSYRL